MIRSTLQHIMNVDLSDETWDQATLPVASGGLGIRRATDVALPAYLSSVAGSHSLITQLLPLRLHVISGTNDPSFIPAVSDWQVRVDSTLVQQPFPSKEKIWDEPLVRAHELKVLSAALE